MRRGARSIRGAMGAYALAAALAVGVLALVLWAGGPDEPRCLVSLPAGSPWRSATLDDGRTQQVVERGGRIEAPPARYRVTLEDDAGRSEVRTLVVDGPLTTL